MDILVLGFLQRPWGDECCDEVGEDVCLAPLPFELEEHLGEERRDVEGVDFAVQNIPLSAIHLDDV